ncbi:hypothetical protein RBSH_04714 [Rhodopirellula baltica SH28]|uniref:Uncharacterized protein n=1 Tax=Rhodopirellula baltica SH28 TaxID=993517 RepID=K5E2J8_RHOBT|nr:hypothetical protein RBSH_04714 [Rhodopirellula baltica SH28]
MVWIVYQSTSQPQRTEQSMFRPFTLMMYVEVSRAILLIDPPISRTAKRSR